MDICLELACACGQDPQAVARWPWRRVQRAWSCLRRRQRRELRERLFLAHQSGLGLMGGASGGGQVSSTPRLDDDGLRQARSLGIPVKTVKVADG